MTDTKIIYGYVPGAPMLPSELANGVRVSEDELEPDVRPKRKKPGPKPDSRHAWRTGYPPGTKKQDIIEGRAVPISSRPPPMAAERCVGCRGELTALTIPMLRELVRIARDRLAHGDGDGRTDLLYLAARMDGFCSLGCWKEHGPEAQVRAVSGER